MKKPPIIDADFEVVHDPRWSVVNWQKPRLTPNELLAPLRWGLLTILGLGALFTLMIGLLGGDVDTNMPKAAPASKVATPAGVIAVQPVEKVDPNVTTQIKRELGLQ